MYTRLLLALVASTLVGGGRAEAGLVCDAKNALAPFGMIAGRVFKAKLATIGGYGNSYCSVGMTYESSICTNKAIMMGAGIYGDPNFDFESHLVSTRASGTAITFKHPAAKYPCETNGIEGDVITAGGQVKISGSEEPDIGTIDTSGTHPLVSSCAGAIVDMVGLSDAIAAAPAVQTIDNLIVRRGEEATLDVTGGGIVRIERLSLEGVRGQVRYGYNNQCLYAYNYDEAGSLEIIADEDDEVILDVGQLKIGDCAYFYLHGDQFLINLAGKGKKARVGVDSNGNGYPVNILAPRRTVKVEGEKFFELGTWIGNIWADKVLVRGLTYQENQTECP